MRWIHGYLLFCSFWASLLLRDLIPLIPLIQIPVPSIQTWQVLISYLSTLIFLGWALPGRVYRGVKLSDGTHLMYKCNGLQIVIVVTVLLAWLHFTNRIDMTWVANHYDELFVAANIFAFGLSTLTYIKGRYFQGARHWMSSQSNHGWIHDYVMGTELNPHLFGLDIKFFSYRPSMAGWYFVNLSFLLKHFQLNDFKFITMRMCLYQVFTNWYVIDYFINEQKMVYTWDIIAENFGLMLIWGDYVFIVFAFSVQNFFLLHTSSTSPLSIPLLIINVIVFLIGFAIFRGANSQKHQFKANPTKPIWGKIPNTIDGKLLISGYWGIARHMNYTGDCTLAFAFCMPCGFQSSLPYLYFIYLLLLTLHREKRDEGRCSDKYKQVWKQYCEKVPYRMFPFIY